MLDHFDRIYVINLPARSDRRRQISRQLASIGLSLQSEGVELFAAIRPKQTGGFRTIGAHGCFLSHLAILNKAAKAGFRRILILEDDVDFAPAFRSRWPQLASQLHEQDWGMFYGGYVADLDASSLMPGLASIDPSQPVGTTHFVALSGQTIDAAARYLAKMLERPPGDPRGGPMDVDGAYCWFRRECNIATQLAVPVLGYQRASRTDITESNWMDRLPVVRDCAALGRRVKNAWIRMAASLPSR